MFKICENKVNLHMKIKEHLSENKMFASVILISLLWLKILKLPNLTKFNQIKFWLKIYFWLKIFYAYSS